MEFFRNDRCGDNLPFDRLISEGVQMCPFLRNIGESTNFSFLSPPRLPAPVRGNHGPIFEDGPNFELAFKLFHGHNGVVPLCGPTESAGIDLRSCASSAETSKLKFHPLAASAAAISLSTLGASGPFSFDAFMANREKMKRNQHGEKEGKSKGENSKLDHEAWSNEWLQTGNCPIAKSFRAVSGVLPMVAKIIQPPPDMKIRCPPAVVAARAALARTAAVKTLRPQPVPIKVFAVGLLGMAVNVPLGIWREHTEKFSPAWFTAVHASVLFVAMLRKAVNMPKFAMAFTIAASILGQVIGSRAEKKRLELIQAGANDVAFRTGPKGVGEDASLPPIRKEGIRSKISTAKNESFVSPQQCGKQTWSILTINSSADPVGAI